MLHNFIENLLACDTYSLLFASTIVLISVVPCSIALAEFILINRLLKDNCNIKSELIALRAQLVDFFKIAGLIVVGPLLVSAPVANILVDLIYVYYDYAICDVEAVVLQFFVSLIFGIVGYLIGRYITRSTIKS